MHYAVHYTVNNPLCDKLNSHVLSVSNIVKGIGSFIPQKNTQIENRLLVRCSVTQFGNPGYSVIKHKNSSKKLPVPLTENAIAKRKKKQGLIFLGMCLSE